MRFWLSHPTGNAFVRGLLAQLVRDKISFEFFTTLGISDESGWARRVPRLARREYRIPAERLHPAPWLELARLIGIPGVTIDTVYNALDRSVARRVQQSAMKPDVLYACEDGALSQFRAARGSAIHLAYDLPIAYWETVRGLLEEEAARRPAWEPTLVSTRDPAAKLERKTQELELADSVICPSRFVRESVPVEHRAKCFVSPFGSPAVQMLEHRNENAKLRVLFAGSMTQRKGLADLFDAMRLLQRDDVELCVLGAPLLPLEFYRREYAGFRYEPPRPHSAVLELMQQCDLLVLPSIAEGRALVQQEALACGLPIIVTANAGGDDLIEEGRTGFLVPIRSPETIAEKINWFAENRRDLGDLRPVCRNKAAGYTWEDYASRVLDFLTRRAVQGKASSGPQSETLPGPGFSPRAKDPSIPVEESA